MASGVKCSDAVMCRYNQLYKGKAYSYCVFKLNDAMTEIVPDEAVDEKLEDDKLADYKIVVDAVQKTSNGQPRYIIYDVKYDLPKGAGARRKILFILWCPDDTATLKSKMVYAASKSELKKLEGVCDDCQVNDMCELCDTVDEYVKGQQAKGR